MTEKRARQKRAPVGSGDVRSQVKGFRFNADELAAIHRHAAAEGLTLSDYARARLLKRGRQRLQTPAGSVPADSPTAAAFRELAEQVRRVGVNLNQITHVLNRERLGVPRELSTVLDNVRRFVDQAQGLSHDPPR